MFEPINEGFRVTDGFTQKVNHELHKIWEGKTGVTGNTDKELKSKEIKIQKLYQAVEDGLPFDSSMKTRLHSWRTSLVRHCVISLITPTRYAP
ncbi:hypothetical protein KKB99_00565 [bacterium]|nr:hypothetical protein [bacterium]MBU1024478.1 hypothetical protein [bacterium]